MTRFEYPEVRTAVATAARIDPERVEAWSDDLSRMVSVRMPVVRVDLASPTDEEVAVAVEVCRTSSEAVRTTEPGFAVFGWGSEGRRTHAVVGPVVGSGE